VDAFRRAVAARGPARGVRVASGAAAQVDAEGALAELRVLIPPDLWPRIRKARRVILVPHGALDLIPFEALEVEPGKRWIEVGPPITYASSATHWYWCKRQRDAQRRRALPLDLLALGSTESGAAALAGTRRECEAAVSCFPKARALLDTEATRENLVQLAPRARLLHFATHGADASLVLTGGRLRLLDLLEDWRDMLSGCELVALSACETAVGQTYVHEGVFALPWGFHYAGAPSVIASLWRVDDASTAELFADFYARVEKGEAKLAAFTEARKALRKRYPDPYFWAPFVYIGDPR